MKPKTIQTKKAPLAVGPYSQAVVAGDMVYCSGQIGLDPQTGELKEGIQDQTRQVMENLKNVLIASGSSLNLVAKVNIYLTDIADYPTVNSIYAEYFPKHKPARVTVAVASLPKGALVEIDVTALAGSV